MGISLHQLIGEENYSNVGLFLSPRMDLVYDFVEHFDPVGIAFRELLYLQDFPDFRTKGCVVSLINEDGKGWLRLNLYLERYYQNIDDIDSYRQSLDYSTVEIWLNNPVFGNVISILDGDGKSTFFREPDGVYRTTTGVTLKEYSENVAE